MANKSPSGRYVYGGAPDSQQYEYVGTAYPAGSAREAEMPSLEIYRNVDSGELYYRSLNNFQDRMERVS